MRITKIDIPKSTDNQDGLDHIKMDKLGDVVLIAGKNGSGKTRTLEKIFQTIKNKPSRINIDSATARIAQLETQIASDSAAMKSQIQSSSSPNTFPNHLQDLINRIAQMEQEIKQFQPPLNWKEIETSELADSYSEVRFVPKHLDLQDCNSFSKVQIKQFASQINTVGMNHLLHGTLAKIQDIQDRWFNVTHQHSEASEEEKTLAESDYQNLKNIINAFLALL